MIGGSRTGDLHGVAVLGQAIELQIYRRLLEALHRRAVRLQNLEAGLVEAKATAGGRPSLRCKSAWQSVQKPSAATVSDSQPRCSRWQLAHVGVKVCCSWWTGPSWQRSQAWSGTDVAAARPGQSRVAVWNACVWQELQVWLNGACTGASGPA